MSGSRQPAYFDRTFQDALGLLMEARDYAEWTHAAPAVTDTASPANSLIASRETFRLTTRLTEVMAWLLACKAVLNGELSQADITDPEWRLGARDICDEESGHDNDNVPPRLQDLLVRSHHLYTRVSRLDSAVEGMGNPPPAGFPPVTPQSGPGPAGPT